MRFDHILTLYMVHELCRHAVLTPVACIIHNRQATDKLYTAGIIIKSRVRGLGTSGMWVYLCRNIVEVFMFSVWYIMTLSDYEQL